CTHGTGHGQQQSARDLLSLPNPPRGACLRTREYTARTFSRRSNPTRQEDMMRASLAALLAAALCAIPPLAQRPDAPAASSSLDYEFFKSRVQPVFVAQRAGHARCVACHTSGTPLRLQPLASGASTWSDEDTRKNFEAVQRVVLPGSVTKSRLLVHPLAQAAGGDFYHSGGKHWTSQNDPEWQTLKAWVVGDAPKTAASAATTMPAKVVGETPKT